VPTRFQLAQHLQVPCSAILATAFVLAIQFLILLSSAFARLNNASWRQDWTQARGYH